MKIRYTMLYSSKLVAVVVYSIYYNNIEAYTIIVYTSLHTIIVYSVYYIVVVVYTISLPSFRCLRVRVYDSGRQMYLYIISHSIVYMYLSIVLYEIYKRSSI